MSVLSWGKCTIEHAVSENGAPKSDSGSWTAIDTPKEDTTKLTATAGTEKTANEEGGETVDAMFTANSYQFEFDIFVKKGGTRPFTDKDGPVEGEYAFRVTPQDETCEGFQIDRAILRVEDSYATADGILLHHVAKVLKPASGKMVKPYTKS